MPTGLLAQVVEVVVVGVVEDVHLASKALVIDAGYQSLVAAVHQQEVALSAKLIQLFH